MSSSDFLTPPTTIQEIFDRVGSEIYGSTTSSYTATCTSGGVCGDDSTNSSSVTRNSPRIGTRKKQKKTPKEAFDSNPYVAMLDVTMGYEGPQNRMKFLYAHQPAFIAHNMLSKDMYNLPFSTMGHNPLFKDLLLAGYYASLSNNCEYCSCHSVAIADQKDSSLRDRMIFHQSRGEQSPSDKALTDVALSLGRFPADLCVDELLSMKQYYTSEECEWIILSLCFLGCSNFLSDTFGVRLDEGAIKFSKYVPFSQSTTWDHGKNTKEGYDMGEVITLTPSSSPTNTVTTTSNNNIKPSETTASSNDNNNNSSKRLSIDNTIQSGYFINNNNDGTVVNAAEEQQPRRTSVELKQNVHKKIMPIMKVIKKCPKAMVKTVMMESNYKSGVPGDPRKACLYLKEKTGYAFPLIKSFHKCRNMVRVFSAVIRDQFDPKMTQIGLTTKALCTLLFSGQLDDEHIQEDACQMLKVFSKKENIEFKSHNNIVRQILDLAEVDVPTTKEECRALLDHVTSIQGISSKKAAATLVLARAAVNQPKPDINSPIVSEVATLLSPSEITETFFWLSLQIIFHRHQRYHEIKSNSPAECWDDSKVIPRREKLIHSSRTASLPSRLTQKDVYHRRTKSMEMPTLLSGLRPNKARSESTLGIKPGDDEEGGKKDPSLFGGLVGRTKKIIKNPFSSSAKGGRKLCS